MGVGILLVVSCFIEAYKQRFVEPQLQVYSQGGVTLIDYHSGDYHRVWKNDSVKAKEFTSQFWNKRERDASQFLESDRMVDYLIEFEGLSFLLLKNNWFRYKLCSSPFSIDVIVIDKGIYPSERLFDCFLNPSYVILSSNVSTNYQKSFEEMCNMRQIECYSISELGVWSSDLLLK